VSSKRLESARRASRAYTLRYRAMKRAVPQASHKYTPVKRHALRWGIPMKLAAEDILAGRAA
jgi:hypothetical protein